MSAPAIPLHGEGVVIISDSHAFISLLYGFNIQRFVFEAEHAIKPFSDHELCYWDEWHAGGTA